MLIQSDSGPCDPSDRVCGWVLDATNNEAAAEAAEWLADTPVQIVLILFVAWLVNKVLRKVLSRATDNMVAKADQLTSRVPGVRGSLADDERSRARTGTLEAIVGSITTTVVTIVAAGAVLGVLGVSLAALFASAGVVGVALGFGAQNLVRDVLAGWFILVEDRYGVGDTIDAGAPAVGVVERITLRSTRLRDINGTVWHVANGEIVRVGNQSQNWSRAVVDVLVRPDADIERACNVLEQVGEDMAADDVWSPELDGSPEVYGVHLIEPAGVTLRMVARTRPASQFKVEREARRRVLRAFEAAAVPLAAVPTYGHGADPGATPGT